MAPPQKRAVAPGAQPVRIDNVKERSWINTNGGGLVGQIFFATDNATLDADDQAKLDAMAKEYEHDMILNPKRKYHFFYFGYADHRAGDKYNLDLSKKRADAVELYLRSLLSLSPNYVTSVQGMGIDENDDRKTTDPKKLAVHRRVDIIGPKLRGVPPPDPPPPPPKAAAPKLSRNWKARMKKSGSTGLGPFQGDRFFVDIVDSDNNLVQEFVYSGVGLGKSATPVGLSYSPSPSDWNSFTTDQSLELADFEGFAFHTAIQAQQSIMPGFTGDLLILTLAHSKRNPDWVYLTYKSFTVLDPNAGLGAAQTGGTLEPTPGFGGPRIWNPTDP